MTTGIKLVNPIDGHMKSIKSGLFFYPFAFLFVDLRFPLTYESIRFNKPEQNAHPFKRI